MFRKWTDEFCELTHTLNSYDRRRPTTSAPHAPPNSPGATCTSRMG